MSKQQQNQQPEIVLFRVKSDKPNAPKMSGFIKNGETKVPVVAFDFTSKDGKYEGLRVVLSNKAKEASAS